MKILHYVADRSGVFLYRAYYPSIALQDNTDTNVIFSRNCSILNPEALAEMNWCDIAVFHRMYIESSIQTMKHLKKIGKKVVFEIDDDWLHLNPDNPFQKTLNENPQIIKGLKLAAKEADYITVTNERLANIMKKFNPNIKIIPNYISSYFFDFNLHKQEKEKDCINLLWSGAQNHLDNLKSLVDPLKILFEKYDNIKLWIVGSNYGYLFPFIPKSKLRWCSWTGLENYASNISFGDIGLAPMVDNRFNASKSNIRVLEYGYLGLPIVASNVYAYKETLKHGKNGFLVDDTQGWVDSLSLLIEDKKLRKKMGREAHKMAIKNTIENNYKKYLDFYKELVA